MATNYDSPGEYLELTAPTGGVVSGGAYLIGSYVIIATVDAAQTEKFVGALTGVWKLPKVSAQAWTEGVKIYWDDTAELFTTTVGTNVLVGAAAKAAVNPSAIGYVRLDGVVR